MYRAFPALTTSWERLERLLDRRPVVPAMCLVEVHVVGSGAGGRLASMAPKDLPSAKARRRSARSHILIEHLRRQDHSSRRPEVAQRTAERFLRSSPSE